MRVHSREEAAAITEAKSTQMTVTAFVYVGLSS